MSFVYISQFISVFCDLKGCEKKVTGFFGAQLTRIVARTADGALGSRFYCGRGPPGMWLYIEQLSIYGIILII